MSGIKRSAAVQWLAGVVSVLSLVACTRFHPGCLPATSAMPRPSTSSTLCSAAASPRVKAALAAGQDPTPWACRDPADSLRVPPPQPGGRGGLAADRRRPQPSGAQWQPATALCGAARVCRFGLAAVEVQRPILLCLVRTASWCCTWRCPRQKPPDCCLRSAAGADVNFVEAPCHRCRLPWPVMTGSPPRCCCS